MLYPGFVSLATLSVTGTHLLPQSDAFRVQPPALEVGISISSSTTENVNYPMHSSSISSSDRRFDRRHYHHRNDGTVKMSARGGEEKEEAAVTRGGFVVSCVTAAAGAGTLLGAVGGFPGEASATGMLDFPPAKLNNRYFVMRAGEAGSDKEGRIQSHPIDKLHMDNRLTEQGVAETQKAAGVLRALGVGDPFIWADISSRAQDTARILAQELDVRQERIVPEYAFLDPRGMGIFDGKEAATVLPEVYKADAIDQKWRPPPNNDGTPNESVGDVFVRVRQLMSKLETQYMGEDVVIIGADSDCLSVLQSFVLGEELGAHSKYYLRPGEGRQLRVSIDTELGYEDRRKTTTGMGSVEGGAGVEFAAVGPGGVSGPSSGAS